MATSTLGQRRLDLHMQEGWSAFILLALALVMVTWSIGEAGYGEGLNILVFVTMGAILAGLFLAKSRFPGILVHLFSLVYGIAWIAFIVSYRLPETFGARDRLLELGYRLGAWFQNTVLGGELGTDPLMFGVVMAILFWLMSYIAMWFTFRAHNLWAALLPSGVTLMLNLYYGPERIAFALVPYLLFILLFTVRFNLFTQESSWRSRRVRYDTDIVYSFLRYGATLAVIALALAWVVPTAATSEQAEEFFSRFSEPWTRVKEEWIRLFSTLQSERVAPSYASFGGSLELGGPVNLGNATLMDVQATYGRYWRAVVYDTYTGDGWTSSETGAEYFEAGDPAGDPIPFEARRTITQTFTLYMPETTQLYALGQPERFSLPIRANVLRVQSPDGSSQVATISMVNSRHKLDAGETYMVISSVPSADEPTMRQSGKDLPTWTNRYLQLPDDIPQRVIDLAQEITAGQDNFYDQATAIQDYLRQYTYNEKIERPPVGTDRVDYFLFESKEGYCNYYASAMVVMARAVGIPARLAAGYTQGDWERDAQAYRVREYHSHAWVEVFLPRFGWIEFEPTASQELIVRPRTASTGDTELPTNVGGGSWEDNIPEDMLMPGGPFSPEEFERLMRQQRREEMIRTWTRIGGVVAVSLVIILIAWWQGRKRMEEAKPAALYYERMVGQGNWWGCKIEPFHTAHEYAYKLSTSIDDSEGEKLIYRITDAYVGERYGKKNPARYQPDFAWRDLHSTLTRWGIRNFWNRLWRLR